MRRCPTCGQLLPQDARAHRKVERIIRETQEKSDAEKRQAAVDAARRAAAEILEDHIRDLEAARNPYTERAAEAERRARESKAAIAEARKNIDRMHVITERVRYWVRGFRDLRLWLVESSLVQLEIEANAALHALGLEGWRMEFQVERETKAGGVTRGFTVLVESPDSDGAVPWEAWSGGESQRLRIACAIGLSNLILAQRGAEFNFEFWDEPSSWLTEEGVDALLRLLAERAQETGRKVLVADHRALGFGGFTRTVQVERSKSGSTVK